MFQWTTQPLAPKRELHKGQDPNWTLSADERCEKARRNYGELAKQGRDEIEGARTALTQFAVRNQRIVADPYPGMNSCPRQPQQTRTNPLVADKPGLRATSPAARVSSCRVTFNPALQRYESREVATPPANQRGLASANACFAVDPSQSAQGWKTTSLDVADFTKKVERPSSRGGEARGASMPKKPDWWGS